MAHRVTHRGRWNGKTTPSLENVLDYDIAMEWPSVVQALVPVLVASVSILILAGQVRQQNRLERKKIEVEYLRQVLEVLQAPLQVLQKIQDMADELVLKRHTKQLSQLEVIHEMRALSREWSQTLQEFDRKLAIVLAYAAEQKLHDLQNTLQYAFNTAHKLEQVVADAIKRGAEGPPMFSTDITYPTDGEVAEYLKAQIVTSGRIVRRIKELYDYRMRPGGLTAARS
jgi:hypothetical protein